MNFLYNGQKKFLLCEEYSSQGQNYIMKRRENMNKKIVSGLLAASLLAGGTSVFAQDNTATATNTTDTVKEQCMTKKTGLENALQHVQNETARQAIMANIEKQKATATTKDSITVTPVPVTEDKQQEKPKADKQDVIVIKINGKIMISDQNPIILNNRTVVPLRSIFEALGANIQWDGKTSTVHAGKGKKKIKLKIGDAKASVDGKEVKLDQKAVIINGRTMVPVRFVSEALGAKVEWDAQNRTIQIKY
jgi:hypothetical protein